MVIRTNADKLRNEFAPLYMRYPGRLQEQDAHLEFDPENLVVTVEYDLQTGNAVKAAVWNERILHFDVPTTLKGCTIANMLEDPELLSLLARIVEGYTVKWNGSNYVGCLTDEAKDAAEKTQEWIDSYCQEESFHVSVYSPKEWLWLCNNTNITNTLLDTDYELDALAIHFEKDAKRHDILIDGDMLLYLEALRKMGEEVEELERLDALENLGNEPWQ